MKKLVAMCICVLFFARAIPVSAQSITIEGVKKRLASAKTLQGSIQANSKIVYHMDQTISTENIYKYKNGKAYIETLAKNDKPLESRLWSIGSDKHSDLIQTIAYGKKAALNIGRDSRSIDDTSVSPLRTGYRWDQDWIKDIVQRGSFSIVEEASDPKFGKLVTIKGVNRIHDEDENLLSSLRGIMIAC